MNEFKDEVDEEKLMSHGLVMILDYNEDRMGLDTRNEDKSSQIKELGDMNKADKNKNAAKIYIETLGM